MLRVLDRFERLNARLGERILHSAPDARESKLALDRPAIRPPGDAPTPPDPQRCDSNTPGCSSESPAADPPAATPVPAPFSPGSRGPAAASAESSRGSSLRACSPTCPTVPESPAGKYRCSPRQVLRIICTSRPHFQQLQPRRAVSPTEQLRDQRRDLPSTINPRGNPNEKRSAGRLLPMMITEGRTMGANSVCPCTSSSISSGKMNSTVIACIRARLHCYAREFREERVQLVEKRFFLDRILDRLLLQEIQRSFGIPKIGPTSLGDAC